MRPIAEGTGRARTASRTAGTVTASASIAPPAISASNSNRAPRTASTSGARTAARLQRRSGGWRAGALAMIRGVLRGRDIVCVGFADWDTELWTNQHHLMSRLARENRVLFVESLGLRQPQLAGRDLRRIAAPPAPRRRAAARGRRPARALAARDPAAPLRGGARAQPAAAAAARAPRGRGGWACADRSCGRTCRRRRRCWTRSTLARRLPLRRRHRRAARHRRRLVPRRGGALRAAGGPRACERAVARRAACGRSTGTCWTRRTSPTRRCSPVRSSPARSIRRSTRCRIRGSSSPGAVVATKLDVPLLVALARMRPQWSFALVGPVGAGDPAHRRLGARGRAERPPARTAPLRASCRTSCAAPTRD